MSGAGFVMQESGGMTPETPRGRDDYPVLDGQQIHPLMLHTSRSQTTRRVISFLLYRDGTACSYCGAEFTKRGLRPTLDHRHPRSKGGTRHLDNLVLACNPCNRAKGDMDEAEFRSLRWSDLNE